MQKTPFSRYLTLAAVLLGSFIGLRFFLPIFLPFLLAGALALAAEPLVGFLCRKTKMPRAVATGLGITMTLVMLILLLMILLALLMRELGHLAGAVPDLEATARQGMVSLEGFLSDLANKSPKSIRPIVQKSVSGMFSGGTSFIDQLATKLLGLASGLLSHLPDSALGFGTWLLASFMISARLPKIKSWLAGHLPASWKEKYLPMLSRLKHSVLGWLVAQFKLMSLTFLVLTLGFFVLQISYAPLWAALISLVDALPILGTGTVLVPWALVCWLQGDSVRAIGLLGVYAVAWLLRSVLEPRLIGKQLGLDPLLTLFSMYAGYRLFGLGGMIFAPLAAVTVTQIAFHPGNNG